MKKLINAVENKCNECDNKACNAYVEPCRGFKPYRKPGFSLLESAIGTSATAIHDLLDGAGLQLIPTDTERGFNLAVV